MDFEIQNFIEPIELLDPAEYEAELSVILGVTVKCNKGYVCGGGEVEIS
jgi:hypothetical protein